MPMSGGYWGGPWAGFGWLFPVIGLLFMGLMMFLCCRMMGGMMRRVPERNDAVHQDTKIAELHRAVQQLREEVRRLRDRE